MKVLILHQHFKTPQGGGAIRSYYLARALVEGGIETVVITGYNGRKHKVEMIDGIKVHWLPVGYDNRFGFYKRVFSFLNFVVRSARVAARHRDAAVCYAISTPLTTGLAALRIRGKYRIPYIFEVGDLWPDAPIQLGFIHNRFIKRALYAWEKLIYRSASSIVALSNPIREEILKKAPGKIVHLVPNMADTEFYKPEAKQPALKQKFGVGEKFVVSYIGAVGVANGLHFLLDCAAAAAREALPIQFLICGDGAMTPALKRYAEALKLPNLDFLPFTNRNGVREVMNVTDATFVSYLPIRILETGSPNKYFDGLAGGKLAIVNFGGWIKDEIETEACGVYVEGPEEFVRKLKPFLSDELHLRQYQDQARRLAEKKYSRARLAPALQTIVAKIDREEATKILRQ